MLPVTLNYQANFYISTMDATNKYIQILFWELTQRPYMMLDISEVTGYEETIPIRVNLTGFSNLTEEYLDKKGGVRWLELQMDFELVCFLLRVRKGMLATSVRIKIYYEEEVLSEYVIETEDEETIS